MPTYKNLFTNPSFESAAGTVTVRTNLATNTLTGATLTGLSPSRGTLSTGTGYVRLAVNDTTPGGFAQRIQPLSTSYVPVTPGQAITIQARGRYSASGVQMALALYWLDSSNALIGAGILGSATAVNAATFTDLAPVTAVAPANAARVLWYAGIFTGTATAGDLMDFQSLIIEQTATPQPFFDGSTSAAGDFSFAWTGAANASTSIQTAPGAAGLVGAAAVCYQSSEWAASGTKSLRISSRYATVGSAFAELDTSALTYGSAYTVVATGRRAAAGSASNSAGIAALWRVGSYFTASSPLPNTVGQFEVRLSFQYPADATEKYLRLLNGDQQGQPDVWWDNVAVVPIPDLAHPYTGPAFDGSTPSRFGYVASWDGAADASTSTLQTIEVTVTPYVDANPAPRAEVFVEDPPPGFVTLTLFAEARSFPVPGGILHPSGSGVSVLDTAVPFGIPVTYQAELFDPSGTSLGFLTSDPVTVDCEDTWVSQPLDPTLAVKVDLDDNSATDLTRAFDGETVYTDGATVGVWVGGRRRALEGINLNIETATTTDADMLQQILGSYDVDQVPVLCVRTPPGYTRLPRLLYMTAPKPVESDVNVRYGGSLTMLRVTGDEVRRPAPGLITPLLGYDDIDAFFGTYSAIDANYGSYLARDRDYSKAGYAG